MGLFTFALGQSISASRHAGYRRAAAERQRVAAANRAIREHNIRVASNARHDAALSRIAPTQVRISTTEAEFSRVIPLLEALDNATPAEIAANRAAAERVKVANSRLTAARAAYDIADVAHRGLAAERLATAAEQMAGVLERTLVHAEKQLARLQKRAAGKSV